MKLVLVALALTLVSAMPALAAKPGLCHAAETDAAPKPLPSSLVAAARTSFGYTQMPPTMVIRMTVFRCAEGRPLMCSVGANLPCGKANTARSLSAVSQWCVSNPQSDFVPAYVTGHDSLFQWRCTDGKAVASNPAAVDAQGYFIEYWKAAGR